LLAVLSKAVTRATDHSVLYGIAAGIGSG